MNKQKTLYFLGQKRMVNNYHSFYLTKHKFLNDNIDKIEGIYNELQNQKIHSKSLNEQTFILEANEYVMDAIEQQLYNEQIQICNRQDDSNFLYEKLLYH